MDVDRGFGAISAVLSVAPAYRQVVAGDFDGDGADDVFWYRSSASVVTALSEGNLTELSDSTAVPQEMLFTSIPSAP